MERPTPNPIISGFAPDPSVCLIGDTFFLVNSSFHVFPGIPIYESKDLVSWTHIGNAINRPSQLSLLRATTTLHPGDDGNTILATGGLYAPTIRYHNGVTYILCTNVIHASLDTPGNERNFVIHTTDIRSGNWSDPVYYSFRGIDPSILFDDDGKVYVQGTSNGFQIFNMEIEISSGKMITEPRLIWTGWDKRFPEGPHIYKKDGWYYLLCAEGGTFTYHMVTMARSRSIWGPYEECPHNPIWTAHGTSNYVQHTGHADLFQDAEGRWWIVMLGVRNADGRYVMGRESFLSPVEWPEGGWPSVQPLTVDLAGIRPGAPMSGARDGVDWLWLRDPELHRYQIDRGRDVQLLASTVDLTSPDTTVTFIGKRQRLLAGSATVTLCVTGLDRVPVRAGLAMYKDEHRFLTASYDFTGHKATGFGTNAVKGLLKEDNVDLSPDRDIRFRVSYTEQRYRLFVQQTPDEKWRALGEFDASDMTGFDFTGPLIGMFAVGPDVKVQFKDFQIDAVDAGRLPSST